MLDLIAKLGALLMPMSSWVLDEPEHVPDDLIELADPMDPLAQSRLWGAIYSKLPTGFLVETCIVESGGCETPIGIHAGDAHLGRSAYTGVWARSKVDHACEFYPDPDAVDDDWWPQASTRGNHGLIAAYHVHLLGPCVPLEALDVPFFSAWAAARKAAKVCASLKAQRKSCTRERLRCAWAHAELGSRSCRAVVKRFKSALARHRKARPDLDPRKPYTLNTLRKMRREDARS